MVLLQVHFEVQNMAGAIVAVVGFLAIVIPLSFLVWNRIVRPIRNKFRVRYSPGKRLAFNDFRTRWMLQHLTKAIFVLDEDKRCIQVNHALTELLDADSSELLGRKWYGFLKTDTLTSTINKWDEAYKHQGPYRNISVMIVNGEERMFRVSAEPFIYHGEVLNYIGILEPVEQKPALKQ